VELADFHIRANAVSPAVVVTPIHDAFIEPAKIEELWLALTDKLCSLVLRLMRRVAPRFAETDGLRF
jgi:NAD(P)-dependent dehydrogenase (short-subunit alcohol dehydrogenase family)